MCDGTCNNNSINEGLNGYNSYTFTTASFVMPAINNATPVTINLLNDRPSTGSWIPPGSLIFIAGNYLRVVSSTENTVTVTNPTTSILYTNNDEPGAVIPANQLVVIAGEQGPPTTLPRRSVMVDTSSWVSNPVIGSGYQTLLTGTTDKLSDVGDVVDILMYVKTLGSAAVGGGIKMLANNVLLHEIVDDLENLFLKVQIRKVSSTQFSFFSEIYLSDQFGTPSFTNQQLIPSSYKNSGTATVVSTSSLIFSVMADPSTSLLGMSLSYLTVKFTPYDN